MILNEASFGNQLAGIGNSISNSVERQLSNIKAQKEFTINNLRGLSKEEIAYLQKAVNDLKTPLGNKIKDAQSQNKKASAQTTQKYRYFEYVNKLLNSYNRGINNVNKSTVNAGKMHDDVASNVTVNSLPNTWKVCQRIQPSKQPNENVYYKKCLNLVRNNPAVNDNKLSSFVAKYVVTGSMPIKWLDDTGIAGEAWVWRNNTIDVSGAILALAYNPRFAENQDLVVIDEKTGDPRYLTFDDIKGKDAQQLATIFKDAQRLGKTADGNQDYDEQGQRYANDKTLAQYNQLLDRIATKGNNVTLNKDTLSQLFAELPERYAKKLAQAVAYGFKNRK